MKIALRFWRKYKRFTRQGLKMVGGRTKERLVRRAAWNMHKEEFQLVRIEPDSDGWIIWVRESMTIMVVHSKKPPRILDAKVRLNYHEEPDPAAVGYAAYLSLA